MLNQEDADKIRAAQEALLDTLGVPATWIQAKEPQETKEVVLGFKSASWRDEELINAFGIGAKVFTVKASDIAVIEKFDRFTIHGERYTADSAMPVHLNGLLFLWKVYIRGK